MELWRKFDGFISMRRRSGERIAGDLVALLSGDKKIKAAWEPDCTEVDSCHVTAAGKLIADTKFSVILFGPERFEPPAAGEIAFQQQELDKIRRRQNNLEWGSYGFFPVLLLPGPTDSEEIAAWQKFIASEGFSELFNSTNLKTIPYYDRLDSKERLEAINDLVNSVVAFFAKSGVARVADGQEQLQEWRERARRERIAAGSGQAGGGGGGSEPPPERKAPGSSIEELERAYIERMSHAWLDGRVDELEGRKLVANRAADTPFQFSAARFCELFGAQRTQMLERSDHRDRQADTIQPVSTWLFSDDYPLLVLFGEAGAGKTTTMGATAAAYAAPWSDTTVEPCGDLAAGAWWESVGAQVSKQRRVPVLMSCATAVAHLDPRRPHPDALLDAIAGVLHNDGKTSSERRALVKERMRAQPYVLLLDALDECNAPARLVRIVAGLSRELGSDCQLKVIISSRPDCASAPGFDIVDLQSLRRSQIEWFIEAYARSAVDRGRDTNGGLLRRLQREVLGLLKDERSAGLLSSPLMLNAFCWLVGRKQKFAGNRVEFCARVVSYLLADRPILDGAGVAIGEAVILRMLGSLAYEALQDDANGIESGAIPVSAAVERVRQCANELALAGIDEDAATQILQQIESKTSLLRARLSGEDLEYRFTPLILCEFLAGEHIRAAGLDSVVTMMRPDVLPRWTPAFSFAYALRVREAGGLQHAAALSQRVINQAAKASPNQALAWLRTAIAMMSEKTDVSIAVQDGNLFAELWAPIEAIIDIYRRHQQSWPLRDRADIADRILRLSRLCDRRRMDLPLQHLLELMVAPRIPWVDSNAKPLLAIADVPVLVGEYRLFLAASEANAEFWDHAPEGETRQPIDRASAPSMRGGVPMEHPPDAWSTQADASGLPVVYVSWFEAVAYARWRSELAQSRGELKEGEVLRLPTSAEFAALNKAFAQGTRFPWVGDGDISEADEARVNWRGADLDRPSAPGVFAPYGRDRLFDFGSNVSVWTIPERDDEFWPPRLDLEDSEDNPEVAGGSWADMPGAFSAKVAGGITRRPDSRSRRIGIRLVKTTRVSGAVRFTL